MNPVVQRQLDDLKRVYPGASATLRSDGSVLIVVPDLRLPDGWNERSTTVRFLAPVQYPIAQPDCFWTDPQLRLMPGNRTPQNTNTGPIPPAPGEAAGPPLLWFSWHVQGWDPNRGSLLSFLQVIKNRLDVLQ